ncbi:hypothetical protein HYPSUDRAFT_146919 [Hypholoma sublateritium FD-334 SS-4]|uniref:Uncharacterized protein n=1 Tax=Hypholoma sublateritium (strain FD-334 SS-4) TaxID=945553 RepID=A0A0D2P9Q3_HYPSF|nr:hypothetical protein HYPSUDRAFT_146919 [Hypholoma sublateritium FD-334 SS-4]
MLFTSYATIHAEDPTIYSKFTAKGGMWVNSLDHDEGVVAISYSVNSDVTVPKFWSAEKALLLLADPDMINGGFDSFRGTIGNGQIFIKTGKGITIKGPICGGPSEGQTIVGSGTWTKG